MSLGDFTAFYAYLLMLLSPMRTLGISLGMAQRATASGARLFEILDREPRIAPPADAPAAARGGRARRAARRHLRYEGAARAALRDVDARGRPRAGRSRWSARPARARRRSSRCCRGSTTRPPARCWSTAPTCATSTPRSCARRSPSSTTRRSCSAHRCTRTSPTPGGRRRSAARRSSGPLAARRPHEFIERLPGGLRHARRRARPDAQRRPAPARGDRPRAPRRPAHPDPRRRHLVGRRLDRAGDQGRRCAR